MNEKQKVPDMGVETSRVFRGEYASQANREMYAETAEFFANVIKKRLPIREEPYALLDVGSFRGELMDELLKKLAGYKFKTVALDINKDALENNQAANEKVVADAEKMPIADKSIDIAIVRYMLAWNKADKQRKILEEISRVCKEFVLIEHLGADSANTDKWRERMDDLVSGREIPKLKRGEHFFSSSDEIEIWLKEAGIDFKQLRSRRIENAADNYVERYGLNEEEAKKTREILGDKNYFFQTDWIIYLKTE